MAMIACVAPADETTSETTSELSVSNWGAPSYTMQAYRTAQVATLNGTTFMVSSGRCGAWSCWSSDEANELYWSKLTATGRTSGVRIPGQSTAYKVSLAAFNGFLYMVHTGSSTVTDTWLSRFDPATETWTTNFKIPYPSFAGPPAIVAYGNRLHFIGTTPGTFQMWYATMTTGEIFSAMTALPGHDTASRPSAAVFNGLLYFVHRWGQTGEIVIGSFNGTTWTAPRFINAAGGSPIRGVDPVIAADQGFLHLIHRRPEATNVWWTYFNGCDWAGEITLNTLTSDYDPSLTQGGPGLVMTTGINDTWNGIIETRDVYLTKYSHPVTRFPPLPPICDIIVLQ